MGDNHNNNELRNITDPLVSHYRAGYSILNIDTIYKVISKGSLYYRGSKCTVIEVKNKKGEILKVRCGRMLEDLLEDISCITYFKTGSIIHIDKIKDIAVEEI